MHRFLISKGTLSTPAAIGAKEQHHGTRQPQKFTTWNCNGFSVRLNTENKQNLDDFVKFLEIEKPDIVTLQEVRMARSTGGHAGTIDPTKKSPKCSNRTDADLFAEFKRRIPQYSVHLSLAEKKYAGQAILVHKSLQTPVISYTFDKTGTKFSHDNEGRIIIAEFDTVIVVSTYTPNNGVTEDKFQRRRNWDKELELFLVAQCGCPIGVSPPATTTTVMTTDLTSTTTTDMSSTRTTVAANTSSSENTSRMKVVVYQGDLNVAVEDADLSGETAWWRLQCSSGAADPDDVGQPGSTINEQRRFRHILEVSGLVDAWRHLHPCHNDVTTTTTPNNNVVITPVLPVNEMGHPHPPVVDVGAPIYTWRGASGPRYFGKGMRIDYHLVSGRLLAQGLVQSSVINGHGTDLRGFMGSDHCPVTLTLKYDWWREDERRPAQQGEGSLPVEQTVVAAGEDSAVSCCSDVHAEKVDIVVAKPGQCPNSGDDSDDGGDASCKRQKTDR